MFPVSQAVFKKLLILFVFCLAMGFLQQAMAGQKTLELGIVVPKFLNVRKEPDNSSSIIKTLSEGKVIHVLHHTGNGWLEVSDGDVKGFIRKRDRYVRLFKEKNKTKIRHQVAVTPPSEHKTGVDLKIEKHTREIREIDSKIKKHQDEIKEFSHEERVVISGLNEIDRSLNNARKKLSLIKKDQERLDGEIRKNTQAMDELNQIIRTEEKYIYKRLTALYKLQQIGKMNVLASADSLHDFLRRKSAMEHVLNADDKIMGEHQRNLDRLVDLKIRLSEQKSTVVALKRDYSQQIDVIESAKKKKKALLGEIRQKKTLGLAAIDSLKDAAEELNQTIQSLDQGFGRNRNGGGETGVSFEEKKGLLKMPVNGKIVSFFGKSTDNEFHVETFHTGIKVRAGRGDPVQAVSGGRVLFSDWLKGYGNLIIIDHGDNYYSLYGHTEEVFKQQGDMVEEREVIATVGDTGSIVGPALHFEIRHRGDPLDPMIWLKKG